jgi:hypothetical protein
MSGLQNTRAVFPQRLWRDRLVAATTKRSETIDAIALAGAIFVDALRDVK